MDWMIGAIAPVQALEAAPAAASPAAAVPEGFARLMEQELAGIDRATAAAEKSMADLAAGRPVEMHEVMISLEKARLGVQTFIQVRNKLVESYQDLMRLQM